MKKKCKKQNKYDLQVSFIKIGRFSLTLRNGWTDSFLSVYFLKVISFKNAQNTMDNTGNYKNGHLKWKEPFL